MFIVLHHYEYHRTPHTAHRTPHRAPHTSHHTTKSSIAYISTHTSPRTSHHTTHHIAHRTATPLSVSAPHTIVVKSHIRYLYNIVSFSTELFLCRGIDKCLDLQVAVATYGGDPGAQIQPPGTLQQWSKCPALGSRHPLGVVYQCLEITSRFNCLLQHTPTSICFAILSLCSPFYFQT